MNKQKTEKRPRKKKDNMKSKSRRMKKEVMINTIINVFKSSPKEPFNYRQISKMIGISNQIQKIQVVEILDTLAAANIITEIDKGRYRYNNWGTVMNGTFVYRQNGKNSFIPEDGGEPILITERNSGHALDGDKVKIQLHTKRKKGGELEGEVIEILENNQRTIVGKLQVTKGFAFLVTEDKTLSNDIFIPKEKLKEGKTGDKAIVRIIEWPQEAKNPIGELIDILGTAGDNEAEMNAILAEFDLPYKYPENVEKAANKISEIITNEEIALRKDFRDTITFTIDPKDAKDFDDALSIKQLNNGNWEVGVHIADVTHYVKPESLIDREAYNRATSIYLVDRTIPMLPERLCNQICSLRPNEEKLCFSVIFELNTDAEVIQSHITRTIIKSNRRFTYEEAQQIIETQEGEYKEEILTLNDLAQKIREKRFKSGAIAFDRYEVKFDIDETGKPLGTYIKISKEANKLIEEFMLLANLTVAEFIGKSKNKTKKTFVYRVHDQPNPEKLRDFSTFIYRFGYKMSLEGSKTDISKNINQLLNKVQGKPEENLIETLAIRSMQKAHYTTENIGHYGLAIDYYTHFTSPIRRYPDMMVHRLLERYLAGGRSVVKNKYEDYCKHCSEMENLAANAERASIKYKQVEFMKDKLGQVFDGVVSGVTEWGLYVELNENKCEGLIPMRDLNDDYYEFDEKNYCLIGKKTRRTYQLGDTITVKIAQANLERKQLDFTIV
ncbi:MAG: ribonuclease R [Parabacteroides distasonis]|nr:ribonuclease R [Parabacteroides distasonis]